MKLIRLTLVAVALAALTAACDKPTATPPVTPVAWEDRGALEGTAFEEAKVEEGYMGLTALTGVWSGVTTLHRYTDAEPYWIVMVGRQLNGWGAAAYYAAEVLTEFATTVERSAP